MPNRFYSDVNPSEEKGKGGGKMEEVKESGKKASGGASFKEGENPNASVPKLGSQKGAE